jgi:hypothetical protein
MLGDHARNFAWGGSMALRRETFEAINVRSFWVGSISDDYGVTRAARAARMRIAFSPSCLIPSYGACTWSELLEFTTRQVIIVRVYDRAMWLTAFISQYLYSGSFWALLAASWLHRPALLLWLALFGLSAAKAAIRIDAVSAALPDAALSKHRWSYILWAPFTGTLYAYNLFRSALTRQMVWRQIHYTLISPSRVMVRHGAGES